jgi:CubicO group peptidase (beta-lactamase class C family)
MSLKRCGLVLSIALLLVAHASSQTPDAGKLPDTPAGRTLGAFLKAFNTGSPNVLRRFHADTGGDENNAQEDMNFYNQSGPLKVHSVKQSSDYEIEVLVSAEKGERWLSFTMQVGAAAPHPPEGIRVQPASAPDGSADKKEPPAARKLTEAEMVKEVESYLDQLSAEDRFSGVALVAKDGKPLFKKAYGLADKARKSPNNTETKFNLGSMNKMFTSVAIAQLAEQGKLSFDDTVGKHLKDYPDPGVRDKVTIHHLLTHTSGMGSYWNKRFDQNRTSIRTVSDYLALFAGDPLSFEPGARFKYSNSGFIVLGAIIEKVSSQSYYDYVRDRIFKPAGMTNTGYYEMTEAVPNLALGYTKMNESDETVDGPRRENSTSRPNRGGPAGGGYSTVDDLLKFQVALFGHKLLGKKYTDLITTAKVKEGYAYGFGERIINGIRRTGHNGGAPGIAADLQMYPDLGVTVAILTNYDPPDMMAVSRRIAEMITGK